MHNNPQQLAIEALTQMLENDFLKACWAFQKQEIPCNSQGNFIDDFLKRRRELQQAIDWIQSQPLCETPLGE